MLLFKYCHGSDVGIKIKNEIRGNAYDYVLLKVLPIRII